MVDRGTCCIGGYWPAATLAYAFGLGITLVANIYGWTFNGVQGQPALLYLVPCTVGSVLAVALARGDLPQVWHGTLLVAPVSEQLPRSSVEAETQPFSPCCCAEYYEYDTKYDQHPNELENKQL